MQKTKRVYFAAAAAALFFAAAMTVEGEQAQLGEAKGKRLYASFSEMQAYVSAQPAGIVPVEECYTKKEYEMGLDEGILADLQEYVLQRDFDGALDAYREEALLIDKEELLTICPEFVRLMEEWAEEVNPSFAEYWMDTDNIYQIYALDLDGKEGREILFWYEESNSIFLLRKTEEGYCVTPADIDTWSYNLYGARDARQMVIFSGEENTYYLLIDKPAGGDGARSALAGLVLVRFRLKDDGRFAYESRLLVEDRAAVSARYLYVDNRNVLMHRVKKYIEENAALFGYKLQEEETIWGDEEMPQLAGEEQKKLVRSQMEDLSNYEEEDLLNWYMRHFVVCADYDNDGSKELFWRDDGGRNRLLAEEDGGYRTEYVNLYGENACPVNQMWFVEFAGRTVTFEITELYGREYPVLSAYLIEGDERVPIVTCQLVYEEAVLIEQQRSSYGRGDFGVREVQPLFDGLAEAEEAANVRWEENLTALEESKGVFSVTYTQQEIPFSEGLLALVRQEYARILAGETESCLAPYTLETEGDRKAFLQYGNWKEEPYWRWGDEGGSYGEELCDWAYRWESSDGTVNYLASMDGGGTFGAVALEWYQDAGEGMEYQETLCAYFRGDGIRMIAYEGRIYCVSTAYDFETKALTGMDILVLGEAGAWESYSISLSLNAEESNVELLYSVEMPEAILSYVEEGYREVLAACAEQRILTGRGESGRIPQAAARLLKNLGEHFDYYADSKDVSPYRAADVDNDGEAEYFRTYYYYPSSYHQNFYLVCVMYGWQNGAFGEISFDTIMEDLSPYRSLLWQLWFEEFDGKTYLFTVEGLPNSQNCLLRVRLIEDGRIEETGVFMLQAMLTEEISRNE